MALVCLGVSPVRKLFTFHIFYVHPAPRSRYLALDILLRSSLLSLALRAALYSLALRALSAYLALSSSALGTRESYKEFPLPLLALPLPCFCFARACALLSGG